MNFSYLTGNGGTRKEKLEKINVGTPLEETLITGFFNYKGEDGFKYNVAYTIDKHGSHINVTRFAIHRIPPQALKSLVG